MPDRPMTNEAMQLRTDVYLDTAGGVIWHHAYNFKVSEPPMVPVGVILAPEAFRGPLRATAEALMGATTQHPGDGSRVVLVKEWEDVVGTFERTLNGKYARHVDAALRSFDDGTGVPGMTLFYSNVFFYTCRAGGAKGV